MLRLGKTASNTLWVGLLVQHNFYDASKTLNIKFEQVVLGTRQWQSKWQQGGGWITDWKGHCKVWVLKIRKWLQCVCTHSCGWGKAQTSPKPLLWVCTCTGHFLSPEDTPAWSFTATAAAIFNRLLLFVFTKHKEDENASSRRIKKWCHGVTWHHDITWCNVTTLLPKGLWPPGNTTDTRLVQWRVGSNSMLLSLPFFSAAPKTRFSYFWCFLLFLLPPPNLTESCGCLRATWRARTQLCSRKLLFPVVIWPEVDFNLFKSWPHEKVKERIYSKTKSHWSHASPLFHL